ncbi:RNA-directed DNA polymerase, eukaryota, reverse transcriptase zinc-binding domain protein [Tanacetum coccineum]
MCSKRPKTDKEKEQKKQEQGTSKARMLGMNTNIKEGNKGYQGNNVKYAYRPKQTDNLVQKKMDNGKSNDYNKPQITKNMKTNSGSKGKLSTNKEWQREMIPFINNLMMGLNAIHNLNMELKLASWNIRGVGTMDKQDEIQKLMLESNLSLLAILETRAKRKEVDRIYSKVFNRWKLSTNMNAYNKWCRIGVGWNSNVIDIHFLFSSWHVMFCLVETVQEKTKFFCSFVYAANNDKERAELWKDLANQKHIVNGRPWVLLGDFNVTLHVHKHSAGSSVITQEIQDFKDCMSNNKLKDILKSKRQCLTLIMASNMIKDITNKEIKEAMFDIDNDKAPRPDGYTSCFFIKAWNVDNILLTRELLKGYNTKNKPKRCALKIDLQKAYAATHGYFKDARGLRQGDLVSPNLITLVMEVHNLIMIKNIKANGKFRYHAGCKDLQLTHLCFADDLMVFCNGDVQSISIVKKSLN